MKVTMLSITVICSSSSLALGDGPLASPHGPVQQGPSSHPTVATKAKSQMLVSSDSNIVTQSRSASVSPSTIGHLVEWMSDFQPSIHIFGLFSTVHSLTLSPHVSIGAQQHGISQGYRRYDSQCLSRFSFLSSWAIAEFFLTYTAYSRYATRGQLLLP